MKISLALSGGGFRATVFHLGVLARLAKENRLEDVILLSTVSGGSLCAGLVFAQNGFQWPSSQDYLKKVEPQTRHLMTTYDLQGSLIRRVLGTFWTILETRASDLSALMQQHWNVTAKLKDLPATPRWMINATTYETGKNFRFERFRMGDYLLGYTNDTDLPVSDAMAASAGFPGLIGALFLPTTGRKWFKYEDKVDAFLKMAGEDEETQWKKVPVQVKYPTVHLWDGGVYDNQGLEGIFDFNKGWTYKWGFLIASDASGRSTEEKYRPGIPAIMRLMTGIMMTQVRSLRTRALLERLTNHGKQDQGAFLVTGNTARGILTSAGHADWIPQFSQGSLPEDKAHWAETMGTAIQKLTPDVYELLFHHGFEVADATLCAYYPDDFKHIPYT